MSSSPGIRQSSSIRQGDAVRLGDHVLYCGDARDIDLAKLLDGRRIDCLACDPPYSIDVAASKRGLNPLLKTRTSRTTGI